MRNKRTMTLAALSIGALMLSACGSAGGTAETPASEGAAENLATTINIAISQAPTGYNGNTAATNSVYNGYVDNLTSSGFAAFTAAGELEPNEDFGTYEKVSDDPLTIKYTINDDAVWSDGVPIDYDDALLTWAALSGTHPSGEKDPETGAESDLFLAASTNGFAQTKMIEGEPGDKEFELVFDEPYADWEALLTGGVFMPAHIAAEQGGLSTEGDGAALVDAIQNDDTAALKPVADFWNTGWDYEPELPALPDTALLPSSGPYKLDNATNGTLTLVKNDKYWGEEHAGKTDTIVFKTIVDEEAVQALQNGDVDVIDPSSPSVDTKTALEQIGDTVTVDAGTSLTFSHVDLDQRPGAVFEDVKVRQAFNACMPRADMVDKFVTPIDPEGTVMNLREYQPGQPDYETVLEGAPAAQGDGTADIEGAKKLLTEAGKAEPVKVSLMYASTSQLRADMVALIKDSCDKAGFEIVPQPEAEWSAKLSQPGAWDAVLFGWSGSGLVASGQSIYVSGGEQNFGGYADPEVDRLWSEIATTTDADKVPALKTELEQRLAETQYNVVLYANADIIGYSSKLEGVELNPTQTGITWNAYSWTKQS
ncbi:ABC transporter family substrate-binding protein [Arthrobacter agilis]|uniref:ABC transporter family substrate-binding protein n=1 Tax=Arthrobacter agilis TaxID=37921 RepID=UPI002788B3B5|nr:ABC transporter family substrate-binding protein [Arthrobacter agilis]MDQ0735473.1 peptide/nickel transport system substrate-binding protein [Arthrobacter agilis]